jgi:hypothetical protein
MCVVRQHNDGYRSLQSLHLLLTRLWAHMPSPPQSRQRRLMWVCSQMLVPPQSLQVFLMRLCSQMLAPPQSLQVHLLRLCSQMLSPPQSLHLLLWRLCWQMLAPPQSLQVLLGAAEGERATDGIAAHGAGEGAALPGAGAADAGMAF